MMFTPGARGALLEVPPPPSIGSTIIAGARGYATGGKAGAVSAVLGAAKAVPGLGAVVSAAESFAGLLGLSLDTKSVAGWNRTVGRVYRAMVLGYVTATPAVMRLLKDAWLAAGDKTGAQFWDRLVQVAALPTEKGGTKKGYGAGAPLGSKKLEAEPGFLSGLTAFVNAVG